MKKIFFLSFITIIFLSSFIMATHDCSHMVTSTDLQGFLNEIPSINNRLSKCTTTLPGALAGFIGDGTSKVDVSTSSGVESFYLEILNSDLKSLSKTTTNKAKFVISIKESDFNTLFSSSNYLQTIGLLYAQNKLTVKGNTVWNKIKLFFAKPFINKFLKSSTPTQNPTPTPAGPIGKPDNCDETYLPGHREYTNNQELWDRYSSDTDKVCQSQYGKGIPSPCIHSIQLSIEGKPYYLCWYNE